MKPSERFLTALRSMTDDKTMERLAIRLDPVLTAADTGVFSFGTWNGDDDLLTSVDGTATIQAWDVQHLLKRCLNTDVSRVQTVSLRDLNAPSLTAPWMAKEIGDGQMAVHPRRSLPDAMTLALIWSIKTPFGLAMKRLWSERLAAGLDKTEPALNDLVASIAKSLEVRFASRATVDLPGVGEGSLPQIVAWSLRPLLHTFVAAGVMDDGEALLSVVPAVDILDSCVPLGTHADDDRTVLLLVE